jgi:exodeoxyribonuclease-3
VKIATWNVNGIRARGAQVLEWMGREQPDVACLQEIKAGRDQVPPELGELGGYSCYWHGHKGYSGVALLVRKETFPEPAFEHPSFDHEQRIVTTRLGEVVVASIYVPNGGKDFDAKMRFLEALVLYAGEARAAGRGLVLCGDFNVARTDADVHPKERRAIIGQLPEERILLERILSQGLVDLGRALDPENDRLFTWWPPWRSLRQKNVGWRLDYVLASADLAKTVRRCVVQAEVGTSDHAPVLAELGPLAPPAAHML